MKKTIFLGSLTLLLFIQCGKEKDPYLISEGAIGNLTRETEMRHIDSLFAGDSIVRLNAIEHALGSQGEIEIYEKGGDRLLLLSPDNDNDPNAVITNIQVFDSRYKTEKGLNKNSTFKDVKENYTIASVETTINAVVVFLEETDVFLTIDKKQLPEDLRYNPEISIEASQIPDDATFKYFMIGWDQED
jgi:hypothetical protein